MHFAKLVSPSYLTLPILFDSTYTSETDSFDTLEFMRQSGKYQSGTGTSLNGVFPLPDSDSETDSETDSNKNGFDSNVQKCFH